MQLTEDDKDIECPILFKGNDDLEFGSIERFPAIYFNPKTGKIQVSIQTLQKNLVTIKSRSSFTIDH